jgi:hypothetical protein
MAPYRRTTLSTRQPLKATRFAHHSESTLIDTNVGKHVSNDASHNELYTCKLVPQLDPQYPSQFPQGRAHKDNDLRSNIPSTSTLRIVVLSMRAAPGLSANRAPAPLLKAESYASMGSCRRRGCSAASYNCHGLVRGFGSGGAAAGRLGSAKETQRMVRLFGAT